MNRSRAAAWLCAAAALVAACGSTVPPAQRAAAARRATGASFGGLGESTGVPDGVQASVSTVRTRTSAPGPARSAATSPSAGKKAGVAGPIEVGVLLPKVSNAAAAFGLDNNVFGDPRAASEVVINDVNAHGGLGGRKLDAIYAFVDVVGSQPYDAQEQAACSAFTEDHHVAVVAAPLSNISILDSCLAKHGIPLVTGNNFYTGQPNMVVPTSMRIDRTAASFVSQLSASGFFARGAVVGVMTSDQTAIAGMGMRALDASLTRAGVKVAARFVVHFPAQPAELSQFINDEQAAEIRFAASGVTHVISFTGATPGFFMRMADSQGYRPAYGLTSMDVLYNITQVAPASQMAKATGVGWAIATDVVAIRATAELSATGRRCKALLDAGGVDTSGGGLAAGLPVCDTFSVIKAVLDRDATATAVPAFLATVESLGTSLGSASTSAMRFGPGRHDGAAFVRRLGWRDDCSCFVYTSPPAEASSP